MTVVKEPHCSSRQTKCSLSATWWWWLFFTAFKGLIYFWIYSDGEYFQFIRILVKHWCKNMQTQIKKTTKTRKWKWSNWSTQTKLLELFHLAKAWGWKSSRPQNPQVLLIPTWMNSKILTEENPLPPSTTPPTPRAPPAGLFASSPAPWSRSLSSGVPPSCKTGGGSWRHPA